MCFFLLYGSHTPETRVALKCWYELVSKRPSASAWTSCAKSLTIRDEVALPGALGIFSGKRALHSLAVF